MLAPVSIYDEATAAAYLVLHDSVSGLQHAHEAFSSTCISVCLEHCGGCVAIHGITKSCIVVSCKTCNTAGHEANLVSISASLQPVQRIL